MLAATSPSGQKQMIGEKMFEAAAKRQPELVGNITDMLLEMGNSKLLTLLGLDQQLRGTVEEALRTLQTDLERREQRAQQREMLELQRRQREGAQQPGAAGGGRPGDGR